MGQARRLTVPGRFECLAQIAEFVTQAAREAGLSDDDVFQVEMAVDEACSNIIEHAYAEHGGDIQLECTTPQPGQLNVVIYDHGQPFDPAGIPQPRLGDTMSPDQLNEGGMGLYFMRKLMDEVRFEFRADQGNVLYMSKRRKG